MPFDLLAVVGREPFTFTFDGQTYALPVEPNVPAVADMAEGRLHDALAALLGTQWDRLNSSPKLLTDDTLTVLLDEHAKHGGFDGLGESSASTGSSRSTGRPSKLTSTVITASS